MRQSGRVRCGRGGGRHGRRGPRPQRSPLASRPRSPGTRSARAPRRSSAASRPTPRSRTRSCSLGAARVAACGSSAWIYGGSWSRSPPPAFRSAPPSPPSPTPGPVVAAPTAQGFSLPGWRKRPVWGPSSLPLRVFRSSSEGAQMSALSLGFRWAWDWWIIGDSGISRTELETWLL